MKIAERRALLRELAVIKDRLRRHGFEVTYRRNSRSLSEHIADIKRRDQIETMLLAER